MAKITVNCENFKVDERELPQGALTIGRAQDNDLHINSTTVSSHHARIVTVFNSSYVEDLDSINGTFINGKTVRTHTLHNGDVLTIGRYQLLFQEEVTANSYNNNRATTFIEGAKPNTLMPSKPHRQASPASPVPKSTPGPKLKVHQHPGTPLPATEKTLPDIDEIPEPLKKLRRHPPQRSMRSLRKSDISPLPSLKTITLAVLATIATFTLLMLFFE